MRAYLVNPRLLAALVGGLLLSACGGDGPPPNQPPSAVIEQPQSGSSFVEGETVTFEGRASDQEDGTLSGSSLRWTSSLGGEIGTGGTFTRDNLGVGSHTIRLVATDSDGDADTASVSITVAANQAPTVTISSPSDGATFTEGASITFEGSASDPEDGALTGSSLVWTSDLDGQIGTGESFARSDLGTGTHQITLTATDSHGEDATDQVQISVQPENAPTITSIAPDTMVVGGTATITGENFSATAGSNMVTVGGMTVTVTSASTTSLEVTIPAGVCLPLDDQDVVVSVSGVTSTPFAHPFRPAEFVEMAVGEKQLVQDPASFCLQFRASSSSESYLVGVQSTSESVTSLTSARLVGMGGAGSGAPLRATATAPSGGADLISLLEDPTVRRMAAHREAEARFRERERRAVGDLLAQGPPATTSSGPLAIPSGLQVGDTIDLNVIDIEASNVCQQFTTVQAVVRVIGTKGIWFEDVDNPENGYESADFQNLSDALDDRIFVTNSAYFGPPGDIDGNDRIAVLITKEVNRIQGALGFTTNADLFDSETECAASNEGEIYYAIAPDPDATVEGGDTVTVEDARADSKNILAHELVHVIQFSRMPNPGAVPAWVFEGQATLGEEVVGHAFSGFGPRQNIGFNDAFFGHGEDDIRWYIAPFIDLLLYYGFQSQTSQLGTAPHECSWLALPEPFGSGNPSPCESSRAAYGVPWSLFRWMADHFGPSHPGGEQGFFRDMVASSSSGYAMLEEMVGLPVEEILARWAATLYVDDRVSGADPMVTMLSWDLFNIDQGLSVANDLETATLNPMEVTFGDFSNPFRVRGGSSAYVIVSGSSRPATAIRADGQDGSTLPGIMQVWIVRMQ